MPHPYKQKLHIDVQYLKQPVFLLLVLHILDLNYRYFLDIINPFCCAILFNKRAGSSFWGSIDWVGGIYRKGSLAKTTIRRRVSTGWIYLTYLTVFSLLDKKSPLLELDLMQLNRQLLDYKSKLQGKKQGCLLFLEPCLIRLQLWHLHSVVKK